MTRRVYLVEVGKPRLPLPPGIVERPRKDEWQWPTGVQPRRRYSRSLAGKLLLVMIGLATAGWLTLVPLYILGAWLTMGLARTDCACGDINDESGGSLGPRSSSGSSERSRFSLRGGSSSGIREDP